MTLDITQFYQTFFDEADELLAQMEQLLLNLDVASPDPEDLAAIFAPRTRSRAAPRRSASPRSRKRRTSSNRCSIAHAIMSSR